MTGEAMLPEVSRMSRMLGRAPALALPVKISVSSASALRPQTITASVAATRRFQRGLSIRLMGSPWDISDVRDAPSGLPVRELIRRHDDARDRRIVRLHEDHQEAPAAGADESIQPSERDALRSDEVGRLRRHRVQTKLACCAIQHDRT